MTESTQDQPATESLPDRVAALFDPGQPEEPEIQDAEPEVEGDEPDESDEPEPDEVETEIDGETFRLPKKVAEAAMRQADYTRKTQELAEQRRQVDYARKALETSKLEREFHDSAQQELQQLQLLDTYLEQLRTVNLNDLQMEDGFKHWMQVQQLKEQRENVAKSVETKRAEFTRKQEAALEQLKSDAREVLNKQFPGLTDATLSEVATFAKSAGYTDQDVSLFAVDPRATALLLKAMKYDALQSKATPVAGKTPVIKPGSSNPMPQQVRDKLNFRKAMKSAGSSQQKAKLIEQRLGNMF